jgi:hypothetical protein
MSKPHDNMYNMCCCCVCRVRVTRVRVAQRAPAHQTARRREAAVQRRRRAVERRRHQGGAETAGAHNVTLSVCGV